MHGHASVGYSSVVAPVQLGKLARKLGCLRLHDIPDASVASPTEHGHHSGGIWMHRGCGLSSRRKQLQAGWRQRSAMLLLLLLVVCHRESALLLLWRTAEPLLHCTAGRLAAIAIRLATSARVGSAANGWGPEADEVFAELRRFWQATCKGSRHCISLS
jgi:hypothetical protein